MYIFLILIQVHIYFLFIINRGQCFNINTGQYIFFIIINRGQCCNISTGQCIYFLFIINLVLILKKYTLACINDKEINEKYT